MHRSTTACNREFWLLYKTTHVWITLLFVLKLIGSPVLIQLRTGPKKSRCSVPIGKNGVPRGPHTIAWVAWCLKRYCMGVFDFWLYWLMCKCLLDRNCVYGSFLHRRLVKVFLDPFYPIWSVSQGYMSSGFLRVKFQSDDSGYKFIFHWGIELARNAFNQIHNLFGKYVFRNSNKQANNIYIYIYIVCLYILFAYIYVPVAQW